MNDMAKKIGLRLRASRKAAGFRSATAFATEHHIPMSTYSQHENGKRSICAEMLLFYCNQFGVQPGWLLSGQGAPFPSDTPEVVRRSQLIGTVLDQEDLISMQQQPTEALAPITGTMATVDMHLYKEVLMRLLPLFGKENMQITDQELIDFSVEVYNGVVTTSASLQDKLTMIDLSINSLKRGVSQQVTEASEKEGRQQSSA